MAIALITMIMNWLMVAAYIVSCLLIGTKPCKYFQLNAAYFNADKGIFSKLELDQLIPKQWRLWQEYDHDKIIPPRYPVFLKPEWGQNAGGIFRADNKQQLSAIRKQLARVRIPYLIQEVAQEQHEYEIFALKHHKKNGYSVWSVTEIINQYELNPINSIHNKHTRYHNISRLFSAKQRVLVQNHLRRIGDFNISRVSVRANSMADLLVGKFHVIELNLFTPMPIHLLDKNYTIGNVARMMMQYMVQLAQLTKRRDKTVAEHPIYLKTMLYNRAIPLANYLRTRL